jgi:hypothetical protein
MQLVPYSRDEELAPVARPYGKIEPSTLRIIASWIAERDRLDREVGALIDRGFVVAQAHA